MSAMMTPQQFTGTPLTTVVDMSLYRAVTERCRGRILPFGVRQLIKNYAFVTFDNDTLREAVQLWCGQRAVALQRYGDINDWDVSQVTEVAYLFCNTTFNDRIDRWDLRNVTSMDRMFYRATAFNQPLDTWDVSRVTTMSCMFNGAKSFNQSLSSWDVRCVTNMEGMFSGATSHWPRGMSARSRVWPTYFVLPRRSINPYQHGTSVKLQICRVCSISPVRSINR
jgi:surface protein